MRSFLGVTVHITSGSEITTFEIGARQMDQRTTTANLVVAMREMCRDDWKINYNKVRAVVTDGGANIKAAAKQEFGAGKHLSYLSHRFDLIGQKAIGNISTLPSERTSPEPEVPDDEDDIDDEVEVEAGSTNFRTILNKVKRKVTFFKKSEIASLKLRELQKDEHGKLDSKCLNLIQKVKTRWNSCFDMLDRYIYLAPLVTRVVLELQRTRASKERAPELISPMEEYILKEIRDLLAPLARATKEVSTDKIVTLSKSIPVINNLRREIDDYLLTEPEACALKENLTTLLRDAFASIEEVPMYAAATLLDPRFKKFRFWQDISSRRSDLVKKKMAKGSTQPLSDKVPEAQSTVAEQSDSFWDSFDKEVEGRSAAQSGQDMAGGIPIQFRMYLDSAPVKRKDFPNPLRAWAAIKGEYKYVYQVAQENLSILATSVPSERLFSNAGLIKNQLRTRLSGKLLEILVFLRSCDNALWFE
ncbi:uncharacterized protein LOC106638802 [Copidosoma floridanum]|uniref:uncharacterized protein LOC106638802 n=1 Tax=Copidosoma floridanum TaxID=29053 RepID=UPI0006C972C4|nr:uncharacterized protein LOC106638802 [Copidosoma floridanum]